MFDDVPDSASDFLLFGGAAGLIVFLIFMGISMCSHHEATTHGVSAKIVNIGTCRDGSCVIRVELPSGTVVERKTGSQVFVGDTVHCNESSCFKD
jgi:hypothetical protein